MFFSGSHVAPLCSSSVQHRPLLRYTLLESFYVLSDGRVPLSQTLCAHWGKVWMKDGVDCSSPWGVVTP